MKLVKIFTQTHTYINRETVTNRNTETTPQTHRDIDKSKKAFLLIIVELRLKDRLQISLLIFSKFKRNN